MATISDIKDCLGDNYEVLGDETVEFMTFAPLSRAKKGDICFCKFTDPKSVDILFESDASVILCKKDIVSILPNDRVIIKVDNPRLAFARVMQKILAPRDKHSCVFVKGVPLEYIYKDVTIGKNVSIGEGAVIYPGVVIADNVKIGKNVVIRSNTVIGQRGEAFERDEDNIPIAVPHIGSIIIGDDVEIGSNTTISQGTLDNTIIGNHVKIGDQVLISHNVKIGDRTLVITSSVVCGSVEIGTDCWLSPNCTIMNGVTIGNNSMVGLGAVVLKSIPPNSKVVGNPARII